MIVALSKMKAMSVVIATIAHLHGGAPVDREQAFCLAQAVYWEAGDDRIVIEDKIRVANATLVRSEKRGLSVCDVIAQDGQYPWFAERRDVSAALVNEQEREAWALAAQIAVLKLSGDDLGVPIAGADHFYSPNAVKQVPKWGYTFKVISESKDFIFLASN